MSFKKLGSITVHTSISISLFIVMAGVIYFIGGLATKVDAMVDKNSPSRYEFSDLKDSLTTLNGNLKTLNDYLLNNNFAKK